MATLFLDQAPLRPCSACRKYKLGGLWAWWLQLFLCAQLLLQILLAFIGGKAFNRAPRNEVSPKKTMAWLAVLADEDADCNAGQSLRVWVEQRAPSAYCNLATLGMQHRRTVCVTAQRRRS